jgi:hypothetical protein
MSAKSHVRGHLRPWPAMVRWTKLLAHLGGGKLFNPYDDDLFAWWECQVPFIKDYPYTRIDFSRDPDVIIPSGEEIQGIGNIYFFI